MSYQKIDNIGIFTINNPPANVINRSIEDELENLLQEIRGDTNLLSLVITGAGDRFFCSGGDIKEFLSLIETGGIRSMASCRQQIFFGIEQLPKPTICAVNGLAMGGGLELAMTCDIIVADERAKFALPEVRIGILPGGGGTQRLSRIIGRHNALRMMYTGDPVDAKEALRMGLIQKVVSSGTVLEASLELARRVSSYPATQAIKRAVSASLLQGDKGFETELDLFEKVCLSPEAREGIDAFLEKREPDFSSLKHNP